MVIQMKTAGVHHIALRVTNFDRAKQFYAGTLGFPVILETRDICIFIAGNTAIALRRPDTQTPPDDIFNPFRVGLDHIALGCNDEAELERVASALSRAEVENTSVKVDPTLGKKYVAFKDPDRIAWEFYMADEDGKSQRRAQLRSISESYFAGLAKKDMSGVPYAQDVVLRSPLAPSNLEIPYENHPLRGRNAVVAWFSGLFPALGPTKVIEHYINDDLTMIATRADVGIETPKGSLRVVDRFRINAEGQIIEQENHYDPRPALAR